MNAEIISVGTELLLGHTVNTDTTIVARALSTMGINMMFACTVGDNVDRLKAALQQSVERSDVIITTGGLGPTGDDLTKETVAEVAGAELVMHRPSMERIEQYFAGRTIGETQKKQAMLPENCTVFQNDVGTAPGCAVENKDGKIFIMLPGPPSELTAMLNNYAIPYLTEKEHATIDSTDIHVFGKGEGAVAEMISDLTDGANPTVATYAKDGEMFVRVTAKAKSTEEAKAMCRPLIDEVCGRIGDAVYSTDADCLEQVVVDGLTEQGLHLATAESCTGGLLAKRITDISGSSNVFEMGVVTYANRIKTQLLDVPEDILEQYGAVSEPVARAMAEGVCKKAGSDIGIGITGIAGPTGGTKDKPVGLIYIAMSNGTQTWVRKMPGTGKGRSREYQRTLATSNALDMVRRYLQKLPPVEVSTIKP
jgi:nicotinamide-nucleotide amidase